MRAPITSRGGENRRGVTVPERGIGWASGFGSGFGSGLRPSEKLESSR